MTNNTVYHIYIYIYIYIITIEDLCNHYQLHFLKSTSDIKTTFKGPGYVLYSTSYSVAAAIWRIITTVSYLTTSYMLLTGLMELIISLYSLM